MRGRGTGLSRIPSSSDTWRPFATIDGARTWGLEDRVGSLTPGKQTDVLPVVTDSLGMSPVDNAMGAIVSNVHPGLVDTVLVAGRVVKRDRVLVDHDPRRILERAEQTRDHGLARARTDDLIGDVELGGSWVPRNPAGHVHP